MAHATTRNKWWRVFIPAALLLVWLALAGVGGPYFGKIDQVSSNDLSTFLPKNAESTKVKDELAKFQTSGTIPAIVMAAHKNKKDLLRLVFSDSNLSSLGRINDRATVVNEIKSQKTSGYSL